MNYHSDGHLTSITYTYQFQVPLVVAYLVWCTYLLYMQANQSVECFIFIASLSIISWKSPKNDANTMFFFIMENESRFL